jgi:hypothetical protein
MTILCDGRTLDEREEELLELVSQLSDFNLLNDTATNEHWMFRWLVDDDGRRVCPEDTLDVTQRHIVAPQATCGSSALPSALPLQDPVKVSLLGVLQTSMFAFGSASNARLAAAKLI